ncbi:unnamed protein product [Polarella glacialis]|uniref:Uncharacterized protein n=1 Tax=Polarella glacialis TaxID=89957 RepID=A0A813D581_POLGL|nr:unnamed protein product [Polarella glacialis]CAE8699360.1 unnamed protein product [Polarella glacialis]
MHRATRTQTRAQKTRAHTQAKRSNKQHDSANKTSAGTRKGKQNNSQHKVRCVRVAMRLRVAGSSRAQTSATYRSGVCKGFVSSRCAGVFGRAPLQNTIHVPGSRQNKTGGDLND